MSSSWPSMVKTHTDVFRALCDITEPALPEFPAHTPCAVWKPADDPGHPGAALPSPSCSMRTRNMGTKPPADCLLVSNLHILERSHNHEIVSKSSWRPGASFCCLSMACYPKVKCSLRANSPQASRIRNHEDIIPQRGARLLLRNTLSRRPAPAKEHLVTAPTAL